MKHDATTLALQETLNGFLSEKDKTCDKKEERREKEHIERETSAKLFLELQKKRLDIEEENARTRAQKAKVRGREAEARAKEVEVRAKEADVKDREVD